LFKQGTTKLQQQVQKKLGHLADFSNRNHSKDLNKADSKENSSDNKSSIKVGSPLTGQLKPPQPILTGFKL